MKTIEEKAKAYDESIKKAMELWNSPRTCFDIEQLKSIFPELESEDENLKNKSGYYKAGKFWKASTLWNAVKGKSPQRVPNRYILQECTWNISSLQHFADEVKNVQEVDLNYPIILDMNGNILDGAHRVVKAYLEGKDIDIVYLGDDEWPEPDYDEEKAVKESEDERIYNEIMEFFKMNEKRCIVDNSYTRWIAWLERQKEQKHYCPSNDDLEDAAREFRGKCLPPIEPISDELIDIIKGEFEGFRNLLKKKGIDYEPQRGYWEGFARLFDSSAREYVKEQKPAEKQDYSGLTDFERAIHRGFLCAGVENVPVTIIKETAQECMAKIKPVECDIVNHLDNPGDTAMADTLRRFRPQKQEWSEEDGKKIHFLSRLIEIQVKDDEYCFGEGFRMISKQEAIEMLKSLRPSWKPSKEQVGVLRKYVMGEWKGLTFKEDEHLKSLLIDLENYSHDNR